MYACGELATVVQEQIPLTVVVVDDGGYGMLRFDQELAGEEPFGVDLVTPDFVALAASFGFAGDRRSTVSARSSSGRCATRSPAASRT